MNRISSKLLTFIQLGSFNLTKFLRKQNFLSSDDVASYTDIVSHADVMLYGDVVSCSNPLLNSAKKSLLNCAKRWVANLRYSLNDLRRSLNDLYHTLNAKPKCQTPHS